LLGCIVLPVLVGLLLFRSQRLLLDAATPAISLMLLYATLLALSLSDSARQRKSLEGQVLRQRERSARLTGELQAAQRIQNDALPPANLLHGDARVDLFATLNPAIEVGGDMYDYFLLDADRLFLLLGDVAGKGLSASIFMAVSKALTKSAMLRDPAADIGAVMRVANREVSRDNAESLFVSVFAAILDLRSGTLDYCNAGHENPFVLSAGRVLQRITDGDGPPLCAVADYDYRGASRPLARGDVLCLMTDGVTEALDLQGRLYGHERVEALLSRVCGGSARAVVEALHGDVQAFATGAAAADDLTLLALRWHGMAPIERGAT
jgi:serine phosphatase RsbU (regulator of sigma subunit)